MQYWHNPNSPQFLPKLYETRNKHTRTRTAEYISLLVMTRCWEVLQQKYIYNEIHNYNNNNDNNNDSKNASGFGMMTRQEIV